MLGIADTKHYICIICIDTTLNMIDMKRFLLIAALMLGMAFAATAQPKAIGARMGWGFEASYQHMVNGPDFVEADLGLFNTSLNAAAVYNFMIAQPSWTERGEWGFYAGPGAALGLGLANNSGFNLAAAGQVGLEYTFWFPLQLSFDIRAQLGYTFGHSFYWGIGPALGVRYRF